MKHHKKNMWEDIKGDCVVRQFEIAKIVRDRFQKRNQNLKINLAPGLQATVEQCKPVILIILHFWNKIY